MFYPLQAPSTISITTHTTSRSAQRRATAQRALRESGYRLLGLLKCDVIENVVIVSGVVPSFYLKQIAQEVILRLDVFSTVENRVQVQEASYGSVSRRPANEFARPL